MKTLVAAVCMAVVLPASAQVYKCKEGGTTVFSAMPCSADARTIDVKPAAGASRPAAPAASANLAPGTGPAPSAPAPRTLSERADAAANRRILDDDIWRKQRSVDALHEELQTRQAQLRTKKGYANNNLAGAVWEQSISDEMQAVAAEYDLKIRRANKDLDDLKMRRAQIPNN